MLWAALSTNSEGQDSLTSIQFVTMSLASAGDLMTEEKRSSFQNSSQQDALLLQGLIRRCRKGDLEAMTAIYERFNRSIFNLVYRHTSNRQVAEDLLQEIFLKVFTHVHKLRQTDTFIGWMYRIAINACYSYLREHKVQLQKAIPLSKVESVINGSISSSSQKMVKELLDEAIQNLPIKMRTIFMLHDVKGFKHEEIASMLGCTAGTSKSQLFKARMKIRKHLERKKAL